MSDQPLKVPQQPHKCPVGHLQPHPYAFVAEVSGVQLTTGPICIACVYAYLGRNFRNRPVESGDEA